jgi:hypothetical protein
MDELLGILQRTEVVLHQPDTRRDAAKVGALLHESLLEFGRSGNSYDRAAILKLLASEEPTGRIVSQDFAARMLGESVALLTYKSAVVDEAEQIHGHTLRASIWVHTPDGWKLQFHQGTPTEAFGVNGP